MITSHSTKKLLLTVYEVAGMLGISERTVWRWAARGVIPAPVKQGGKLCRWLAEDIQRYIESLKSR